MLTRRKLIHLALASGATSAFRPLHAATPAWARDPFALGVASGYPTPNGIVLWTRLAPEPQTPGGGVPPLPVGVDWELAEDDAFGTVVARGTAWATPHWGHSVHVEVARLAPARWYYYRFHSGSATSPVGRTRTAPAADSSDAALRFAAVSCQHFEQGHYAAYRHIVADAPDLIVHLGDYIYESSWGDVHVRSHETAREPVTLDDYRARYAHYRSDAALRDAHAACPWLVIWDDHEVDNDYASDRSQDDDEPDWFLERRAQAYQAYYEHMPLPRAMVPFGPWMRIHTRLDFGRLARFHLLDDRQYRSYQPCPKPGRGGSNMIEGCAARLDPTATMLGPRQEAWLAAQLTGSPATWNLLCQQTLIAQADGKEGPGERWYSDIWDGYPAARTRLLDTLATSGARNPVSLGGDVHSFWVNDLKRDFDDPAAATVATEFVTTALSSNPAPPGVVEAARAENSHVRYAASGPRGYLRAKLTASAMQVDLRAMDDVARSDSPCATLKSFVVTEGRAGADES